MQAHGAAQASLADFFGAIDRQMLVADDAPCIPAAGPHLTPQVAVDAGAQRGARSAIIRCTRTQLSVRCGSRTARGAVTTAG